MCLIAATDCMKHASTPLADPPSLLPLPLPLPPQDAPGCHEFLLQDDGKWLHVKETETIGEGDAGVLGGWCSTLGGLSRQHLGGMGPQLHGIQTASTGHP